MKKAIVKLKKLNACGEAIEYTKQFDSPQAAWDACERGDWMLWVIGKFVGKSRKKLVRVTCKCARLTWKWMPKEGKSAIRTAEKWTKGETTIKEVRTAAYAADAAADAAYAADAADAADAARKDALRKCADIVRTEYPDIKEFWK